MYRLTVEQFEAAPGQELANIATHLAESGRVFAYKDHSVLVHDDGRVVPLTFAEGVMCLITEGLLSISQGGMPLRLSAQQERVYRSVGRQLFAPDRVERFFPKIKSIRKLPQFYVDHNRLMKCAPGYRRECVYVATGRDYTVLRRVDTGFPHLRAVFSGLMFEDPVYHGNLVGTLAACLARGAMDNFPLIMFDSLTDSPLGKSCGKTATMKAIAYLLTGEEVTPLTHNGGETGLHKDLATFAGQPGPNPILIDNIRAKMGRYKQLRSSLLKSMTNSPTILVRPHYKQLTPLYDPIVMLSMNGSVVEPDLADSVIRITLTRPQDGTSHRRIEPHPLEYVKKHRVDVLAELYHILENMQLDEGFTGLNTRFYTFEKIAILAARAVGLEACFAESAMHNLDVVVEQLYYLLQDEEWEEATFKQLVDRALVTGSGSELNHILSVQGRTPKGRASYLYRYAKEALVGRTFKVRHKSFTFEFGQKEDARTLKVRHINGSE